MGGPFMGLWRSDRAKRGTGNRGRQGKNATDCNDLRTSAGALRGALAAAGAGGGMIPVIDIAPFLSGRAGSRAAVGQLRDAAEGTGFFLVTGHGVDDAATRALYDAARAF